MVRVPIAIAIGEQVATLGRFRSRDRDHALELERYLPISEADEHALALAIGEIGVAAEILADSGAFVAAGWQDVIA